LPPIGPGRPFVDIVSLLTPNDVESRAIKVAPGYAELTIRRRQQGEDRKDIQLADWFSGRPLAPGEDEIFDLVAQTRSEKHIDFVQWETPEDLQSQLLNHLVQELRLANSNDVQGFSLRLGGNLSGD